MKVISCFLKHIYENFNTMSHHLRQYSVLLLNVKCAFNPLSWRELVRCCIILILGRDVHVNIYQILQINCICIPYEEQIILCRGQVNSWSRSTFCYKNTLLFYYTCYKLHFNYSKKIQKPCCTAGTTRHTSHPCMNPYWPTYARASDRSSSISMNQLMLRNQHESDG
jgi:hypothetical protein